MLFNFEFSHAMWLNDKLGRSDIEPYNFLAFFIVYINVDFSLAKKKTYSMHLTWTTREGFQFVYVFGSIIYFLSDCYLTNY